MVENVAHFAQRLQLDYRENIFCAQIPKKLQKLPGPPRASFTKQKNEPPQYFSKKLQAYNYKSCLLINYQNIIINFVYTQNAYRNRLILVLRSFQRIYC